MGSASGWIDLFKNMYIYLYTCACTVYKKEKQGRDMGSFFYSRFVCVCFVCGMSWHAAHTDLQFKFYCVVHEK